MKREIPEAPEHLQPETAAWWREVAESFELEPHHLRLLTLAAETWDQCQQAREAIAEHGLTMPGRYGQPISRPEVAILRDARIAYARLMRELCLDIEPPAEARPPRRPGTGG